MAVDFRDGWSIDVIGGEVAFGRDTAEGRWEAEMIEATTSLWLVNEPIAQHYRERYPEHVDKIHVVRNGYDEDSVRLPQRTEGSRPPLAFGYLGTLNVAPEIMEHILVSWRRARHVEPLLADATLELRGHIGAGASREANGLMEQILGARDAGVRFAGPVPKAQVAEVYGRWDALLLPLIGGRYMTSGKVYEYMATALPIVSVHEEEHDASTLLSDYPLWTDVHGHGHAELVAALRSAARMAVEARPETRARCRAYAAGFERTSLMSPAVALLSDEVLGS